jgi:hypothetical protein
LKCHKDTPYIAILNKQKCHFISYTKLETRIAELVLSGEGVAVGALRRWVNMWEGEYSLNTVYLHECKWKNDTCQNLPGTGGEE